MRACSLLGHSHRFTAEGDTMRWECDRCGDGGSKRYASSSDAQRYARAFDQRDADKLGKRPLLSLLPLWLARKAGDRASRRR
jgi:hypothetical protein